MAQRRTRLRWGEGDVIPPQLPSQTRLISYDPKPAPVAVVEMNIVNDVEAFVGKKIQELKHVLSRGDVVRARSIVEVLEQCGLHLQLRNGATNGETHV